MAAKPPARRQIYTIACRCGVLAAVHVSTFGRLQVCRSCRRPFTVAWRRDPKTQTLSPIVLAQARTRPTAPRPHPPASPPADPDPTTPRMHLSCSCGYRRPIRPEEASRNTRCPGCGKWMIVEKTPMRRARVPKLMPPAPPAPSLPPPPAPPAAPPPAAAWTRPGTPPASAPTCACGQPLAVTLLQAGSDFTCPSCGRPMKLQKARDPQTLLTVIRPVFVPRAEPPPSTQVPAGPPEPSAPGPAALSEEPASFLLDPKAPADDASFPEAAPGPTQELFCRCGQEIMVGPADAGHPVQCPSCSVVLEIQEVRDPQNGAAVLRAEVLGTLDEEWKLEDFA